MRMASQYLHKAAVISFLIAGVALLMGKPSVSAAPTSSANVTFTLKAAKSLCLGQADPTSQISQWSYNSGYFMCRLVEGESGGALIFQRNASGAFVPIFGGGGGYSETDLEHNGIPSSIAKILINFLHAPSTAP